MAGYTSLFKAGIFSIAAFFYSGCSTMPMQIADTFRIKREPIVYDNIDQSNLNNVGAIDKTLTKDNDPKKVDLQILVDRAFIERYDTNTEGAWWTKFQDSINFVNKRFKSGFDIEFDVDAVEYLKLPADCPKDLGFVEAYIRLHYIPKQFDAFVFLSGEKYNKGQGATKLGGNHSVAAPGSYTFFLKRIMQHELSHLFNAEDVDSSKTIMSNSLINFSYDWSPEEGGIIAKNKNREWLNQFITTPLFREVIASFPTEEDRVAAEQLFCYALAFKFHKDGLELAEAMRKKYFYSGFVDSTYRLILELKEKEEKEKQPLDRILQDAEVR